MTGQVQVCTHPGCDRRPVARRLCRAHYQAAWKSGTLGVHEKQPPRVKDPKICPPDHKHGGSLTCYNLHQCRCVACSKHRHDHDLRVKKDKAYGRYNNGLVDVAPVREHVLMLAQYGIGYKRVAQLAGFKSSTPVRTIVWGRREPGPRFGELQKRVKRETAERIMAIKPTLANLADGARIPAHGTRRRIQALATRGWSLSKLAIMMGMNLTDFWWVLRRDHVTVGTHRRMAAVYENLWDQEPPHDDWHTKTVYSRSVHHAKRHGWLPPLAWDDIDDPDEHPDVGVVRQGRATADEVLDDTEFLLDLGESVEQVASMVGRTVGAIAKLAERHGHRDIANRFEAVDRRAA